MEENLIEEFKVFFPSLDINYRPVGAFAVHARCVFIVSDHLSDLLMKCQLVRNCTKVARNNLDLVYILISPHLIILE